MAVTRPRWRWLVSPQACLDAMYRWWWGEAANEEPLYRMEKGENGDYGKSKQIQRRPDQPNFDIERKRLKEEIDDLRREREKQDKTLKEKSDTIIQMQELFTSQEAKNKQTKTELNEANREKRDLLNRFTALEANYRQTKTELNEANREKRDLLNRLSEIAGAKLTDKNPNVTDLSDQDRATKLAERYSELYDNEWTNAFTNLTETRTKCFSETEAIAGLLLMLQKIDDRCSTFSKQTWNSIIKCFAECTGTNFSAEDFPTVHKQLKDARKSIAPNMFKRLQQVIEQQLKADIEKNPVLFAVWQNTDYINSCISVCWKMTIHDPPLCISFSAKKDDTLSKDIYRPYTSDGKLIEYIVWPTLYLHQKGPILAKGVAQGKDKVTAGDAVLIDFSS